jgi:Kef-type K+ transport system membrane component KefB
VFKITLGETILAFTVVFIGVYLVTRNLAIALIFASLAPASAPAGTLAALRECRARGDFSRLVTGVVGFDDAFAILLFVIGLAAVKVILGGSFSLITIFDVLFIEILVGIALGVVFGIIMALCAKYFNDKEDINIIAIFLILACAGASIFLGASYIMACIILGSVFVNVNPQEGKIAIRSIDRLIPPVIIVFFVIAGIELHPALLISAGVLGIVYIISRTIGLYSGAYLGGLWAGIKPIHRKYVGLAILSQAGVAIGLALLVTHEIEGLPGGESIGRLVITVIAATTVVFEIIGPIGVKIGVSRVRGPPKTDEEKILRRLSKTADEVDVFDSTVNEDICVYEECEDDENVYGKRSRSAHIEKFGNEESINDENRKNADE